jgi:cytochrome P450
MQEAKITLARLYQRFTFQLEPNQVPLDVRNTITISPKNGVWVRATPRALEREP